MKILAVSTSSNNCSVSLLEDERLIKELNICNERTHSEKLMPLIEELFKTTNFSLDDIGLIACDIGPGSFTGIRIGVATIKALAVVRDIPVVGVTSLEALAYNVNTNNNICSIIDARNNQVYAAIFDKDYNLVTENLADDVNNLKSVFEKYSPLSFVGDGAKLVTDDFNFDSNIHSLNIGICGYKKFLSGNYCNADNLAPLYLRKSQAERQRNG